MKKKIDDTPKGNARIIARSGSADTLIFQIGEGDTRRGIPGWAESPFFIRDIEGFYKGKEVGTVDSLAAKYEPYSDDIVIPLPATMPKEGVAHYLGQLREGLEKGTLRIRPPKGR